MFKKTISVFVSVLLLLLSLTGCGESKKGENPTAIPAPSTEATPEPNPAEEKIAEIPVDHLLLWLRADKGVQHKDFKVIQWQDQSGNGYHAEQLESYNIMQPEYVENAVNGKPALRLDGIMQHLYIEGLSIEGLDGLTIFTVSANTDVEKTVPGHYRSCVLYIAENTSWGVSFIKPEQDRVLARFGTTQINNNLEYIFPESLGDSFYITTAKKDKSIDTIYVNGEKVLTAEDKLEAIQGSAPKALIGMGHYDTFFPGMVAEIIIYKKALTDEEQASVEKYLKDKYAISGTPTASGNDPTSSAGETTAGAVPDHLTKHEIVGVTASGEQDDQYGKNPAIGAIDGDDFTTRWAAEPMPQWIKLDLGSVKSVEMTRILFFKYDMGRIYTYTISLSEDDSTWTDVVKSKQSVNDWTVDTFPAMNARYVMITCEYHSEENNAWAGIWEAEVYGQ